MKVIRARFCDHVYDGSRAAPKLGAIAVGLNTELLKRIWIREGIVDVGPGILIAGAVEKIIDALAAGAVRADGLRAGIIGAMGNVPSAARIASPGA